MARQPGDRTDPAPAVDAPDSDALGSEVERVAVNDTRVPCDGAGGDQGGRHRGVCEGVDRFFCAAKLASSEKVEKFWPTSLGPMQTMISSP